MAAGESAGVWTVCSSTCVPSARSDRPSLIYASDPAGTTPSHRDEPAPRDDDDDDDDVMAGAAAGVAREEIAGMTPSLAIYGREI